MSKAKAIPDFWAAFEKNAAALSKIQSADDPVYDALLEKLQQIDSGLFFEFSAQPGECEFIVTAEGDQALFALVEEIIATAPVVSGWRYFALKPKLGFPESAAWEDFTVNIADVVFEPLESEEGELGLQLLIPDLSEDDVDNAHNALLRALDHGLGERRFAEAIAFTEVAPLEESADEFIPLVDLERFIDWRRKRKDA